MAAQPLFRAAPGTALVTPLLVDEREACRLLGGLRAKTMYNLRQQGLPFVKIGVDWEKNRILVHSPKTEHNEGGDCRFVPLFPELRPYLLVRFSQATDGTEYVVTRCRDSKTNLRTQMERIITCK